MNRNKFIIPAILAIILSVPALLSQIRENATRTAARAMSEQKKSPASTAKVSESTRKTIESADAGDYKAQYMVGTWYYEGSHSLPQDYDKAAEYFRKAADSKYTLAIGNLGVCYRYGQGVPRDTVEALRLYLTSIVNGNKPLLKKVETQARDKEPFANIVMAKLALADKNIAMAERADKAQPYYGTAANAGSADACRELGLMLLNRRKGAQAFTYFEMGSHRGDVVCTYYTGRMLRDGGMGVKSDPQRGIGYLLEASTAGFPAADYQLGQAYRKGLGVTESPSRARDYYTRAALTGHSNAMYALATSLAKDENPDFHQALEWYAAAVPLSHANAFIREFQPSDTTLYGSPFHRFARASVLYDKGEFKEAGKIFRELRKDSISGADLMLTLIQLNADNPDRDLTEGVKSLRRLAEAENPRAMYLLGRLYETGTGVEADTIAAMGLFVKAAALDDREALCHLGDIFYEGAMGEQKSLARAYEMYAAAGPMRTVLANERYAALLREGSSEIPDLTPDAKAADKVSKDYHPHNTSLIEKYIPLLPSETGKEDTSGK